MTLHVVPGSTSVCADIRGGSLWGDRKHRFSVLSDATSLEPQKIKPTLLYSIIESILAFLLTTKYMILK